MNTESSSAIEMDVSALASTADARPKTFASTWVTWLACLVCIGIFIGITTSDDADVWATLAKFGSVPALSIWEGHYWALITSNFVHLELWHIAFNVYWLWVFGNRIERVIGSLRFLSFVLVAGFVSSAYQLVVTDSTGIGASGIGYALFGFMWATRHRYPLFLEVLDGKTIQLFMIWLVGCIVATYLNLWQVANTAHVAGLLFGGLVAGAFALTCASAPDAVCAGGDADILDGLTGMVPLVGDVAQQSGVDRSRR